ncbi:uncharacterized protein C8A04DRAFT_15133 [Dichotomopilus funicola]|uniref:Uncharacterized protein n=1 Tax=Dichotomopilus funicola TaxID=1934379 RepID=A0AAN6UYI1_9PEZI|nr:hypothetical protein C8A04DRAFT_15133 [Dichotomopilus funicola]
MPMPTMSFYMKPPKDAACILSPGPEARTFPRNDIPRRPMRRFTNAEIQEIVERLRGRDGSLLDSVVRPTRWEDMYRYFDVVDLWEFGAWNLWRVLHLICDQNGGAESYEYVSEDKVHEIDDWVYRWCTHEENRMRLSMWDGVSDVLSVLSWKSLDKLGHCTAEEFVVVRGALRYWYDQGNRTSEAARNARAHVRAMSHLNDARKHMPVHSLDGKFR